MVSGQSRDEGAGTRRPQPPSPFCCYGQRKDGSGFTFSWHQQPALSGQGHSLVSTQFHWLLAQTQYPALAVPPASMKPLPVVEPQAEQGGAVQVPPAVGGVVASHRGTVAGSL